MTLVKLANLANTSVGTVSKAFSGSHEISEETRERIFEIAKENNCFDKYYKAPRKRPMIALMPPEPESEHYGIEIGIFERKLNQMGADTIIAFTRFDPNKEAELFRELAYGLKVDGVILWGVGEKIKNPDEIPLIVITNGTSAHNADIVKIEYEHGIFDLIKTIKEYGHTEVGFIGEKLTCGTEERFKKAMRHIGIPIHNEYIVKSDKRFTAAGADCMKRLIEKNKVPSVIVATYDQIAYGAIKFAQNAGYKIPDDISFIGMDDLSTNPYFDISLSSLSFDFESTCERIVDLIFKRIENKHYRAQEPIKVPVNLKIRDSLKRIK